MGQPLLNIEELQVKRGGSLVLDIPVFSVETGEFLSLIGPNGTGKSTLLLTLACLIKPHHGCLSFHGRKIMDSKAVTDYRRQVSVVFQESLLFDTTVFENVASGLKIRGLSHKAREPIVEKCLDRFGITHLGSRSARKLSGGEAQRTSLARAFATDPEIIFLDEPFSSLDPPTREGLIVDLIRILKETKTTALMATHDQSEALRLSDRLAVMNGGKIIQIGPCAEVVNHPVNEFVASFIGVETLLNGTVTTCRNGVVTVDVSGRTIEAIGDIPPGASVTCCIRPEHVMLVKHLNQGVSSARNNIPAKIRSIQTMGLFYKIHLDCGFPIIAYLTRSSLEELCLDRENDVIASFKATAVHLIRTQTT